MGAMLEKLGFKSGCIYEVIITTLNEDGTFNAAPMGVAIIDPETLTVKPYTDTKTYRNIAREKQAVVNIVDDVLLFYITAIEKEKVKMLPFRRGKVVSAPALSQAKAYIECTVKGKPVTYNGRARILLRAVNYTVLDPCTKPICRAPSLILEAIIHLTRISPLITAGKFDQALKLLKLIELYRDTVKRICGDSTYNKLINEIYKKAKQQCP